MPSLNRAWKALAPFVSRPNLCPTNFNNLIRHLNTIAGTNVCHSTHKIDGGSYTKYNNFPHSCNLLSTAGNIVFQRRGFFGFKAGAMENMQFEEKRVFGYSPEQLFNVVAAVDMYQDFLPWCQRSNIIRRKPDGSFDAELQIGFKYLVESYVSHVELIKPNCIKTTSSQSSIFDHLINVWEFNPGPDPGTCNLYFLVDFKFQSPLYTQVSNVFFKEVVSRLVGSFNDRCRLIYGPGVPVPENTYEHRI
ncbi:hypothetical protein BUALT_Bualt08G0050900 [Buddleja alternifolia]|uniref:Coenzyme Q-binding protein COQ10 START domain-containing protein n=1 Tax=Buddleja alternifolia TaxID=168488 RepID=A0AAV6XEV3_9LAMI|nr:hypothetical protein BUALT_Bualt08G0050900 [Buddleja alternifolia]